MQRNSFRLAALCPVLALALASTYGAAKADVLASDNYSNLTVGPVAGQAVGGTGLTGNWYQTPGLYSGLGYIGSNMIGRPSNDGANAGDTAAFAGSGFLLNSGQVFVSIEITSTAPDLYSSRLDLNTSAGTEYLGGIGPAHSQLAFDAFGALLTDPSSTTLGTNLLVGVLDFTNDKLALFVDPTSSSYYNANGTNNADVTAVWSPPASFTALSYNLVDNLSDTATFTNFKLSTDFASAANLTATTPEPGAFAMMAGAGLAGIGVLRRRGKRDA